MAIAILEPDHVMQAIRLDEVAAGAVEFLWRPGRAPAMAVRVRKAPYSSVITQKNKGVDDLGCKVGIIKIYLIYSMKQLFVPCPSCEGSKLYLTKYDAPLKILKERSWLICKDCDYQIQVAEYKRSLFSV